jgi:hypothetical protein
MSKRRRSSSFVKKILADRGIKTNIFIHHLYCHIAVQHLVIGAIDNPHSSFTDLGDNPIMAEFLTDHALTFTPMLGCASDLRQRAVSTGPPADLWVVIWASLKELQRFAL